MSTNELIFPTTEQYDRFETLIKNADMGGLKILGIYDYRTSLDRALAERDLTRHTGDWAEAGYMSDIFDNYIWFEGKDQTGESYPVCCHCGSYPKTVILLYSPEMPLLGFVGPTCFSTRFLGGFEREMANMQLRNRLFETLDKAEILEDMDKVDTMCTLAKVFPGEFTDAMRGVTTSFEAESNINVLLMQLSKRVYVPFA